MSKVLFVVELPAPKGRKRHAPPEKVYKDATKYSRKQKHKDVKEKLPDQQSGSFSLTSLWNRHAGQGQNPARLLYAPAGLTRSCRPAQWRYR